MNTFKFALAWAFTLALASAHAQGLEGIVVEKYYLSDAADAADAQSEGATVPLTVGTTAYRVYVDMAPGYKFVQLFGNATNNLEVLSTANFYNDPNFGVSVNPGTISVNLSRRNTTLIDSWFTTGGGASGRAGVVKTEDTDGTIGHLTGLLANDAGGCYGFPIMGPNGRDGLAPQTAGTYLAPNTLGVDNALGAFDQTPGNSVVISGGAIAALGGIVGPTASNRVLVGQFTTIGTLTFKLNVQLLSPSGLAETYVHTAPSGTELTHPSLIYVANVPPTISIASPANNAAIVTGSTVSIQANATDGNGTVTEVEFFVDGVSIGTDASAPFSINWTATAGNHTITATATDNDCTESTSSVVNIVVANNQSPVISLTAPTAATAGTAVSFTASASDVDGSVAQVEFFVNGISVGVDISAPFSIDYIPSLGNGQVVTAVVTDNLGASTTSNSITMDVLLNAPPTISITSPTNGAAIITGTILTVAAAAADANGNVVSVEFFVNGVSIGLTSMMPYEVQWTAIDGVQEFTAVATDNGGASATSATVQITVAPNQGPVVVVNAPASTLVNNAITITATASDAEGSVVSVEFFVNGLSIGIDANAPYAIDYTPTATGDIIITAIATDDLGASTTSAEAVVMVTENQAPVVVLTAPATALENTVVVLSATATDSDGTIVQVEFFVNGFSVGTDTSSPYSIDYTTVLGNDQLVVALASDNQGLTGTSNEVLMDVVANSLPVVTITSPVDGAGVDVGTSVTIEATALDTDGTIAQVEFFVDDVSVGVDNSAPYSASWLAVLGPHTLEARATDNNGALGVSAQVSISVTTSVTEFASLQSISIYPVPAQDQVQIVVPVSGLLSVSDMTGRLVTVAQRVYSGQLILWDVSTWAPGMYMVALNNGHQAYSARLMVTR
jgi:hypothetical protein